MIRSILAALILALLPTTNSFALSDADWEICSAGGPKATASENRKAVDMCTKFIQSKQNTSTAYLNRGSAQLELGAELEGMADLAEVMRSGGNGMWAAHAAVSTHQMRKKKFREAVSRLTSAWKVAPEGFATTTLAWRCETRVKWGQELNEAIKDCDASIVEEDWWLPYLYRGIARCADVLPFSVPSAERSDEDDLMIRNILGALILMIGNALAANDEEFFSILIKCPADNRGVYERQAQNLKGDRVWETVWMQDGEPIRAIVDVGSAREKRANVFDTGVKRLSATARANWEAVREFIMREYKLACGGTAESRKAYLEKVQKNRQRLGLK